MSKTANELNLVLVILPSATEIMSRIANKCLFGVTGVHRRLNRSMIQPKFFCQTFVQCSAATNTVLSQRFLHKSLLFALSSPPELRQQSINMVSNEANFDAYALIKEIVEHYKANGKILVLPWADTDAMRMVSTPLQQLLDAGIYREFLFDACIKCEKLFIALTRNGAPLLQIIDIIMDCTGFTYENTMRFIADWTDELLNVSPNSIRDCFTVFLSRGIVAGPQMAKIIRNHPELLFASDAQKMDMVFEEISNFFHVNELMEILIACPQICLKKPEELELRYEYIYFHMGIESEEFAECIRWHELELEEIMMRHEFLRRTGKYTLPDPKRPQLKMENPPMFKIFDTDDHDFATQVAGVHRDEWILFKELYEKEKSHEEMERPYERIKPSMRKSYERKKQAERSHKAALNRISHDEIY